MSNLVLVFVIASFAAGIISFLCSLITLSRCSDEVEAVVLCDEWKPKYKTYADGMDAHRSQRVPTNYAFVKYKTPCAYILIKKRRKSKFTLL